MKRPFPLTCIYALDWAWYAEETDLEDEYALMGAWISGLVVEEDDDKIVLSPFYFPERSTSRGTIVISKHSIQKRKDYK